jgi:hypothetical protein
LRYYVSTYPAVSAALAGLALIVREVGMLTFSALSSPDQNFDAAVQLHAIKLKDLAGSKRSVESYARSFSGRVVENQILLLRSY